MKRTGLILLISGFWLLVSGYYTNTHAQQETLTLLTYYPAPYGVYQTADIGQQGHFLRINYDVAGTRHRIFSASATDDIVLSRNGTANDLVVDTTGRIGIGTNSPSVNLHILSTGNASLYLQTPAAGTGQIIKYGTGRLTLNTGGAYDMRLLTSVGGSFTFDEGSNTRMSIVSGGNVTINQNLTVNGTALLRGAAGLSGLYVDTLGRVGIGMNPANRFEVNGTAHIHGGDSSVHGLYVDSLGRVGIGINPAQKFEVNGNAYIRGSIQADLTGTSWEDGKSAYVIYNTETKYIGYDIAELFETSIEVEPGDVLIINADGMLEKSTVPYDPKVIGVVSNSPAIVFEGSKLQIAPAPFEFKKGTKPPVTLSGRILVKASTENGYIEPGDLLVSSSTPGHAMKAKPIGEINGHPIYPQGCIIGKALEPLNEENGKILVFIYQM